MAREPLMTGPLPPVHRPRRPRWVYAVVAIYALHLLAAVTSAIHASQRPLTGLSPLFIDDGSVGVVPESEPARAFSRHVGGRTARLVQLNGRGTCERAPDRCGYVWVLQRLRREPGQHNTFVVQRRDGERFAISLPVQPASPAAFLHSQWHDQLLQLVGLLYMVIGLLVFHKRPEDRAAVPLLLLSFCMAFGLTAVTPHNRPTLVLAAADALVMPWIAPFVFLLGHSFASTRPTVRTLRFRALALITLVTGAGHFVWLIAAIYGRPVPGWPSTTASVLYGATSLAAVAFAAASVLHAARRASTLGLRRRARVLALTFGVSFAFPSAWMLFRDLAPGFAFSTASFVLLALSLASLPVMVGYAILRYQMFDVRIVLRQGLVYAALSLLLSVGYLALAFGAYHSLGGGDVSTVAVGLLLAALVVGLSLLKIRIQRWMDRLIFRSREVYADAIAAASAALVHARSLSAVVETLRRPLIESMGLTRAVLCVVDPAHAGRLQGHRVGVHREAHPKDPELPLDGAVEIEAHPPLLRALVKQQPAASYEGVADGGFWNAAGLELIVPLVIGGGERGVPTVSGLLLLGWKASGRPFDPEDKALVTTLANQAAVAVETVTAIEQYQRQQQTLVQLITGIVHEVNSPLGALRSSAQTIDAAFERLQPAVQDDERAIRRLRAGRESAAHIAGAGQRISVLMRRLEQYVNLEGERRVRQDLRDCLERAAERVRPALAEGVALELALGRAPVELECYPSRLTQAVVNLLENAAAALADGQGTIGLGLRAKAGRAEIEVADDGPGIPSAQMQGIAEFGFSTRAADRGPRTSLRMGLPYATRVAEELGGHLAVESAEGVGTRVTISLPLRGDAGAGAVPERAP